MSLIIHIAALLEIFCLYHVHILAQRVPPGVNPTHYQQQQQFQQQPHYQQQQQQQFQQQPNYQQQPPPPQYQQQQVPQQQQQQQQHQVPVQQQQVPVQPQVPQGHVPPQQAQHQPRHGHHQQKILDTQNIMEEKDHIAEHLEVPMDTSKMTEQELQFHYFKMHDADNNNKLDGCELIKSLIHWHEQGHGEGHGDVEKKIFKDDELVTLIDPILNMDDNNHDGFIDYPEFMKAQQKVSQQPNKP